MVDRPQCNIEKLFFFRKKRVKMIDRSIKKIVLTGARYSLLPILDLENHIPLLYNSVGSAWTKIQYSAIEDFIIWHIYH